MYRPVFCPCFWPRFRPATGHPIRDPAGDPS